MEEGDQLSSKERSLYLFLADLLKKITEIMDNSVNVKTGYPKKVAINMCSKKQKM